MWPIRNREERAVTISAILERKGYEVESLDAAASVRDAVQLLARRRIGAVPVLRDGEVAGIFSERDIVYRLSSEGDAILARTVGEVMTAPAITVEPGTTVLAALSQMTKRRIRHLPVVDGGRLTGIVSIGDLVAYRLSRIEEEAEAMRNYIQGA
jgi:CBS domain-containing protein